MNDTVVVALVVSIGPTVAIVATGLQARAARREDWKRQDKVALRAEEAAEILAARTEEAAEKAATAARTLADRTEEAAAEARVAARTLATRTEDAARKAAQAADLLVQAQAESIRRTDEVARLAAERDAMTDAQLAHLTDTSDKTHSLVNSDMTSARQSELDQTRATLAALRMVVSLVRQAGGEPSADDQAAIDTAQARIAELTKIVADRLEKQKAIDDADAARVLADAVVVVANVDPKDEKKREKP